MDATLILIAVAIGALVGGASSLVTRRVGVPAGVVLAVVFVGVGLALLTVVEIGAVLAAMLAFAVTAAIFDPRPGKLATS